MVKLRFINCICIFIFAYNVRPSINIGGEDSGVPISVTVIECL